MPIPGFKVEDPEEMRKESTIWESVASNEKWIQYGPLLNVLIDPASSGEDSDEEV